MKKLTCQQGSLNILLIPVILLVVLFIGSSFFAVWAYNGRQDYKNHTDTKIATAVAADKQVIQAQDAKQYAEVAKNPLKLYTGPDEDGSIKVLYPKTWSAYIDTTTSSSPLDAYFRTDYVPSVNSGQTYNLRIHIDTRAYSTILQQYGQYITSGKLTAAPYALPKVPSVSGMVLTGQILQTDPPVNGTMILLPLRSNTLEIWTESASYMPDFTTYILPNLTFSP